MRTVTAPVPVVSVPAPAVPKDSYLATGGDFVNLFQFTRDSAGGFSGVVYDSQINDAEAIESKTLAISGTLSGGAVSLTISGQAAPILGSLDDQTHILTLNLPQQDGTIAPESFHAAGIVAYNDAVNALRSSMNADIQQGQKKLKAEAVREAADARVADLKHAANKLGSEASDALLAYRQALSARAVAIHDLSGPVAAAKSALATAQKQVDAAHTEAANHPDGSNGQVCIDASDAGIAAGDAAIAAHDASYAVSDARAALAGVPKALNAGANAYGALARGISAARDYVPATAPPGFAHGGSFPTDDSATASADHATVASDAALLAGIVRGSKALQAQEATICASVSG